MNKIGSVRKNVSDGFVVIPVDASVDVFVENRRRRLTFRARNSVKKLPRRVGRHFLLCLK